MNQDKWTAVDHYIAEMFIPPDPVLESALEASVVAGLPAINVSPAQGKLLYLMARIMGARRILEIGTLGGYSTIWMSRALPADGRLVTLELDAKHAEVARNNFARAGLSEVIDVRLGPALATLPQLAGPFDLIFIDADKAGYPEYLTWAVKLSRPGTLILADNVVRQGGVIEANSTDASIRGVRRFNEAVAADRRLTATAIQTVGVKGYDGFAAVVVTGGK